MNDLPFKEKLARTSLLSLNVIMSHTTKKVVVVQKSGIADDMYILHIMTDGASRGKKKGGYIHIYVLPKII